MFLDSTRAFVESRYVPASNAISFLDSFRICFRVRADVNFVFFKFLASVRFRVASFNVRIGSLSLAFVALESLSFRLCFASLRFHTRSRSMLRFNVNLKLFKVNFNCV